MQTTTPAKYCARPCMGVVLPGKTCDVTVTMRAEREFPHDMQCKDKFLVQSVVASTGATAEDITPEMFNKKSGKVEEFKLRAIYVLANLAGSSSRATMDDSGVSSKDLFSIHPTELNFPFELNKQTSCHVLQLTNKTKHYFAFKQSGDEEELGDVTDDDAYDTEDSSIDDAELVHRNGGGSGGSRDNTGVTYSLHAGDGPSQQFANGLHRAKITVFNISHLDLRITEKKEKTPRGVKKKKRRKSTSKHGLNSL